MKWNVERYLCGVRVIDKFKCIALKWDLFFVFE